MRGDAAINIQLTCHFATCKLQAGERREDPQQTGRHPREAQAIDHFRLFTSPHSGKSRKSLWQTIIGLLQLASNLQIEASMAQSLVLEPTVSTQTTRSRVPAAFALCAARSRRRDPLPTSVQRARMEGKFQMPDACKFGLQDACGGVTTMHSHHARHSTRYLCATIRLICSTHVAEIVVAFTQSRTRGTRLFDCSLYCLRVIASAYVGGGSQKRRPD